MCGMLHCVHRNEKLMFWKEALAYTMPEAFVKVNGTQRRQCKGAILDVGLDMPDPGMVPNGTKCGDRKVSWTLKKAANNLHFTNHNHLSSIESLLLYV